MAEHSGEFPADEDPADEDFSWLDGPLAELEASDPAVKAAAENLDRLLTGTLPPLTGANDCVGSSARVRAMLDEWRSEVVERAIFDGLDAELAWLDADARERLGYILADAVMAALSASSSEVQP